jgi:hypothetical protein
LKTSAALLGLMALLTAPAFADSPYALPFQLRSVMPGNGARFDSASAWYHDRSGNSGGFASATMLSGSWKLEPELALALRTGIVANSPPAGAAGATSFTNPMLSGLYSFPLDESLRLAFFLGVTVPVGKGGGDAPDRAVQAANSAGILARSAMDNALFAVNYLTVIPGVDLAWIRDGWTVQAEATLLHLMRVRGDAVDRDPSRTNFTSGLGVGRFVTSDLAVNGELRYQHWLRNATVDAAAHPAKSNVTFAVGPRLTIKTESCTLKPGLAWVQALAGPIARGGYTYPTQDYRILMLDVPISF